MRGRDPTSQCSGEYEGLEDRARLAERLRSPVELRVIEIPSPDQGSDLATLWLECYEEPLEVGGSALMLTPPLCDHIGILRITVVPLALDPLPCPLHRLLGDRSEERRVGKECRC